MDLLPPDFRSRFEVDGYFIARDFLSQDVVDTVKVAADSLVDDLVAKLIFEGKLRETFKNEPLQTRLLKINSVVGDAAPLMFRAELHRHPGFFRLFGDPNLLAAARALLPEARAIRIFPNYSMRPKLPCYAPHEVVWHQDAGLDADGTPNTRPIQERMDAFGPGRTVNCWTPLVPVTRENGAMRFLPGSHHQGIQEHVLLRQYRSKDEEFSYGRYAAQIAPEVLETLRADALARDVECGPRDVVFFSHILMHRGGHNNSDHVRWSLDWRYQDASRPTCRAETGHVMWSDDVTDPRVVRDAATWTRLKLT